jgi:YD repeat-containing protein
MPAISFPRLRQWRRCIRFCDSLLVLCRVHVGVALENLGEALGPTASSSRSRKKPRPVQLEIHPLEERAFPGQTVGMLGWGLIGTGLSLIDRSLAEPPSIQGRGLGDLGGTTGSHRVILTNDPPHSSGQSANFGSSTSDDARRGASINQTQTSAGAETSGIMAGSPDPSTPGGAEDPFANALAGPLIDALSGEPLRGPKPPAPIPNDGLPRSRWNDSYGGNNGTASSGYGDTRNGQTSGMPPSTTFNQDGSPQAPTKANLPRLKAQSGPVATPPSVIVPRSPTLPTSGQTARKKPPIIGPTPPPNPTPPSTLPIGPGQAHPNINPPVDGNGGNTTQFSTTVDWLVFPQHPAYRPNGDQVTPLRAQPPAIDPMLGKPGASQASASQSGGPPPAADPENGNLTVTAGGNIPSFNNHLLNASANGSSVPNAAALPPDASATSPTPVLVYGSNTVNVLPVIQIAFVTSTNTEANPTSSVVATLTWNGTAQTAVTFTISSPDYGEVVVMDLQAASPVTTSGLYSWDIKLQAYDSTNTLQTTVDPSGTFPVIVNNSTSPVGYGWQLGIDQLLSVSNGLIWVYGSTGAATYFPKGLGPLYTSPAGDFGTLSQNGDGSFLYTAKDRTLFNFTSSGKLSTVVDAHSLTVTYTYASGNLSTITQPNGDVTSFAYSGGMVSTITKPGNLVTTLTQDGSGNLTQVANPDGSLLTMAYDSVHRLVTQQLGQLTTTYAYNSYSMLTSINAGGNTLSITPLYANSLGTGIARKSVKAVGVETDGLGKPTSFTLDPSGNLVQVTSPDGTDPAWTRNSSGLATAAKDDLGKTTTMAYSSTGGDLTTVTRPDNTLLTYQYETTYHKVTQSRDSLNNVTTYAYNGSSDLVTTRDALNKVTTVAWSNGLKQSVTDPLGHTTTYLYDTRRNLIATVDPLGNRTSYAYDSSRNLISVQDPLGHTTSYAYDAMGRLIKQTDALGDVTTYAYNPQGQLTSQTDPLGNVTQYTYDNHGLQTSVTEAAGTSLQRTTTMVYDSDGRLIAKTDPLNNTTSYGYDSLGRLQTTTNAAGGVETLAYDGNGRMIADTDPLNHTTSYGYDSQGRQITVTDALNHVTTTIYDNQGNVSATVDPLGHRTSYAYDADNRQIQVTDALGKIVTTVYDADGNVIAKVDQLGHRTSYAFDASNRQIQVTDALGNLATTIYDADGNTTAKVDQLGNRTSYAYDGLNHQIQVTDALNHLATTVYDADGNMTAKVDPLGNRSSYTYDALNRQIQVTDALGNLATTVYDANGNMTAKVDQLGNRTSYAYDALNRRTQVTDALGNLATTVYDAAGNTTAKVDQLGNRTSYVYDAVNRQIQVTDALSHLSSTIYDAAGNVQATIDQLGNRTSYVYDADNRRVAITDPLSHTLTTVYDAAGNVVQTIDAGGNTTSMAYDALNRQVSSQDPGGGIATTIYDAVGHVTAKVDPMGDRTSYTFDALNRQTVVKDPLGGLATTAYDAVGNTISITDPVGNKTTMAYDSLNRQIQQTDPLNHSATFAYDAAGRETSATDRNGNVRNFAFDNANRKTGEAWIVSATTTNLLTFSYDAAGNQLTAASYAGTYTMSYDPLNRIATQQEPFGQSLTFTYDAVGNRAVLQDSQGGVTTSIYDGANRLTSRQFGGTSQTPLRVDFTYTPRNQIAMFTRFSDLAGTVTVAYSAYSYDNAARLTNLQHQNGSGSLLANYTYTFDQASRMTSQTVNGSTTSYSYDAANELTADGATNHTYDLNGNRTGGSYQTGTANQLTSDGTWTYSYDNEGNLAKKSKGASAETWTYGYDNLNHMIWAKDSATDGGTVTTMATYVYDVFGNRIEKDVWTQSSGMTTVSRFAYDGQNVWGDFNGSNALQTRYLRGDAVDQLSPSASKPATRGRLKLGHP